MNVHRRASLLVGSLAIVFAACDSDFRVRTSLAAPSPFGPPAPFAGGASLPATIDFRAVSAFSCPSIGPFFSTVSLFIDRRGADDIFVDQLTFQFLDRSGRRSQHQLTRTDLATRFGTTLVSGGQTRTFDFNPTFGCGFISVPSLLVIDLSILNRGGVRQGSTLSAALR
jgi:hypothetical protein